MLTIPDEEEILLSYIESERYEAEQEGKKKSAKSIAIRMLKMGKLSVEEIAQCVPSLSIEDVEEIQQELKHYNQNRSESQHREIDLDKYVTPTERGKHVEEYMEEMRDNV